MNMLLVALSMHILFAGQRSGAGLEAAVAFLSVCLSCLGEFPISPITCSFVIYHWQSRAVAEV
jgi:hypothetical protein